MERMNDLEEMLREMTEKYKNSKSVEVYEEQLEGWFKTIDDLREENRKLNIKIISLEGEIKGLNSVIERLQKEIGEQEAEGGGLFDEIDYRKREAKRLGWKPNQI